MIEVTKYKINSFNEYGYRMISKKQIIDLFQNNINIYMTLYSNGDNNFIIKKDDNLIYDKISELYDSSIKMDFIDNELQMCIRSKKKLYKDGIITWKSDLPISTDGNLYNFLKIIKKDDYYVLKFIGNLDNITISFNKKTSRYGPFVIPFINFISNIKQLTEDNNLNKYQKIKRRVI